MTKILVRVFASVCASLAVALGAAAAQTIQTSPADSNVAPIDITWGQELPAVTGTVIDGGTRSAICLRVNTGTSRGGVTSRLEIRLEFGL